MKNASAFEKNLREQPRLVRGLLRGRGPALPRPSRGKTLFLVGTGTNHHAAQLARWFWPRAPFSVQAWSSFDFSRLPARPGPGDVVAILSHRGTKRFSLLALERAQAAGARVALLTAEGAPAPKGVAVVSTCAAEETGAYTKSLTTTLACLARWTGSRALTAALVRQAGRLDYGPALPRLSAGADVVLVGDGPGEWAARETALKLFETAHLPVRAFGLEEFLHGPRLSLGRRSMVVGFSRAQEPRWAAARQYLRAVGVRFLEVRAPASAAGWLPQLYWGQRLALTTARALRVDPDALRTDDPRWKRARRALSL